MKSVKLKLSALTVAFLMFVAIVYASYWIYSNVRPFTTEMSVYLYEPTLHDGNITLVAKVTGFNPNSGKIVQFGNCTGGAPNDSNFVFIGQSVTNSTGYAVFEFTPDANATYNFVARTEVG